ncbi:MAG: hypothetical protein ACLURV_12990, partial [Gallintestinimicrobium sp.]
FPRYIELIRKYQPNAVIFNDFGPDIRWCGNEAGKPRHSEWAVIPSELCHLSRVQTGPGPMAEEGSLSWIYNTEQELGTMPNILYTKGLTFTPTEINMSIRPGWFCIWKRTHSWNACLLPIWEASGRMRVCI